VSEERYDFDDGDLEFGHCGNIGCEDGWIADCWDGLCVNAEDGCELCMRRCDWCNPRKPAATPNNDLPTGKESGTEQ
jgi:hypothetical protein